MMLNPPIHYDGYEMKFDDQTKIKIIRVRDWVDLRLLLGLQGNITTTTTNTLPDEIQYF